MTSLVFLVEQLATGLYILLAVGVIFSWRSWRRARFDYRATSFELERDLARFHQGNAVTAIILLLEIAVIVLGIQWVVAPTVRELFDIAPQVDEVVTDGVFSTPTPAPLDGGVVFDSSGIVLRATDPAQQVLATPTLTPTLVGTILPNAPPTIGCEPDRATLQIPANGMQVFEPIPIVGTAYTDDFSFYRIELKGPGTFDNFAVVQEHIVPVFTTAELGQFVPAPYIRGEYEFRITVFDITTTLRASCLVNITITDPVPTPTPLGAGG